MYGNKKAFVFSLDAASAMLLIVLFSFFTVIYVESIPYSRLVDYEFYRFSDTGLQVLKIRGDINTAVNNAMTGKENEAEAGLKNALLEVFSEKYKKTLKLEIFDASMNKLKEISASDPEKAFIHPLEKVLVVRRTFVYGNNYGIATLQIW